MSLYGLVANGVAVVGVTTVDIRPPNLYRRKITMVNQSGNEITISKGLARLNQGIVLKSGGSMSDEKDSTGYIYTGGYSAIASGANSNLAWEEETAQ